MQKKKKEDDFESSALGAVLGNCALTFRVAGAG